MNFNDVNPKIGNYLSGFADGEGSFMIVARKKDDYKIGWKISLCFNVAQKESYILAQFKKHLQCGTLRKRIDDVWYFEVNNFHSICDNVIPFFKKFNFLSQNKIHQFSLFVQAAEKIADGKHLNQNGVKEILAIRDRMNHGGNRKNLLNWKSSETIR